MTYLFDKWEEIAGRVQQRRILLFLDYDGTLAPIASTPDQAVMSGRTRAVLIKLMTVKDCSVIIISGRSLQQVKKRTGIPGLTFVGNHGLEIEGPTMQFEAMVPLPVRHAMADISKQLTNELPAFPGALLEDKGLSLSLHYRLCLPQKIAALLKTVRRTVAPYQKRREVVLSSGKKVIEVRPPIVWDKGKAALWILNQQRKVCSQEIVPLAFGDDLTDEDVFAAFRRDGVTVVIGRKCRSRARYYLKDPDDLTAFLEKIWELKKGQ